ncbi:MAG: hypothetical protein IJO58_01890 [Clostridia bacterium]|nr:hypothetical protein [Clostridia bacterium]
MKKKIVSVVLMLCLIICLAGCEITEEKLPEGNIAFASLEEMQACLNGKWFSMEKGIYPRYTEIVFNNNEIKECEVFAWSRENDVNEEGEIIGTKYKLNNYENLNFREYRFANCTPTFKHKTGQVFVGIESLNINIKEYTNVADGKEIKEKYLLINSKVYFKATNKTDLSCENFEMFLKFCDVAINNDETLPFVEFVDMHYSEEDENSGIKKGIDEDGFFAYEGCDSDKISFEIYKHHRFRPTHYFARTDEFGQLYNDIENLRGLGHITNIISLIGTEMPYFNKKDWLENHRFEELKYYLYMNLEGKLVSNIS